MFSAIKDELEQHTGSVAMQFRHLRGNVSLSAHLLPELPVQHQIKIAELILLHV